MAHQVKTERWRHPFSWWLLGLLFFVAACGDRGPGVEIVEVTPEGEVQRTTNFTFVFSDDVVGDSAMAEPLGEAPITFEPAIPGQFQWVAANKLRFYPEVMLAPSTEYTAEVKRSVVSPYGRSLEGERTFTFHTPRLAVNSAFVTFEYDPASNEQAKLLATVEFNYEVEPADVRNRVHLRYADGANIPFQLTTQERSTIMALEAPGVRRADDERKIELHIDEGLMAVGGNQGLANAYTRPATLPGQNSLAIERLVAVRESADSQVLKVAFNLPVRAENALQFITIQPAVAVQASTAHNYLNLRGAFRADQTYQVTVREGITAVDGSQLGRDFKTAVSFQNEDIPPQIDFVGKGFYLTRSGNLNLGLSTINVDKVLLEVDKVYANNLVYALNAYDFADPYGYYYWNSGLESIGTQIYDEELTVQLQTNEEVVTPIDLQTYLREHKVGLFKVTARMAEERWNSVSRWVVATDLGLIAKEAGDDLWVWVHSLAGLNPQRGVEVTLFSQNNQELLTATTDADGVAVFSDYTRFEDEFTPYVVTATLGEDLSFLELTRRQISTSDFDVGGQTYLEGGYEAFLYNERGVYRPGETAHLGSIVRGANAAVPQPFPVHLRVTGPDGKTLSEQRNRLNAQGGAAYAVEIPDYALTGRYHAALLVGEEQIGTTSFSVEEFIPDRMKVSVETDRQTYRPGEQVRIEVEGLTLFGPPAAGRTVQTSVEVEAFAFAPPDYRSFTFGDSERTFNEVKTDLEEARLDDNGRVTLTYAVPQNLQPPTALRAVVEATVLEPGGRGVTNYAGAIVHPTETYVGLRPRSEGYAEPGKAYGFDVVALEPDTQPVAGRTLQVSLHYVYWRRDDDGRYRYVSEQTESVESTQTITSTGGISQFTVTPREYGRYRVEVVDPASGAKTTYGFYSSGWGYAAWAMDTPDRVQLELDKEEYQAGESAQVLVRAPFAGKLLLTVERERVYHHQVVTLTENTATIAVPVTDAYKPNVYISAHLIRSTDGLERDESARAFGVVPLMVNSEANRLQVALEAPEVMRPQNPLTVNLQVDGAQGRPFVTIAAVDEGITQLTDFRTPDPHGYFYGKKRLQVASYDLYGVLLPEVSPMLSSPAGDIEAGRRRRLNPATARRVKPVAFWSGLVETDRRGRAQVSFDIPQFNGTVRLMAVAYDGDSFGSAEDQTIVRDPIVMTPTLPRFIGSGDDFVVPVSLFNGTGRDGTFEVRLAADGPVRLTSEARQSVTIADGREGQVYFKVAAEQTLGKATFKLTASGGGQTTSDETEVSVRPPVPFTTRAGSGQLRPGEPVQFTFPADYLAGTHDFELIVSSFPTVRFAGNLNALLRYPHGCAEQTTSRLFPLLAYYDMARLVDPQMFEANGADYFIEEGIAKLERMQLPSGAFAYWPGGDYSNTWSSVYTAHFLIEARKAGYVVSESVYGKMLDAVASIARNYHAQDRSTLEQSAYAAYVLALAGRHDRSTMLYLKNSALDRLPTFSRYQLAGAFALSGDAATARQLLPQSASPPVTIQERETGDNFNSNLKSKAIMLDILAEVEPDSPQVPRLVEDLSAMADAGQQYTTQENAFAFLALGKILRQQGPADYTGRFLLNGNQVATFDEDNHRFASPDWLGQRVTLEIEGQGAGYYYWKAEGLPSTQDVDEYDHDLTVRRRFLTERGSPVTNLSNFEQGDLIIAELTFSALENVENVAIVDMLPAGFEIENPRLQSRRGVEWISDDAYVPNHMDIRDDRLILYGDIRAGTRHTFYYGIRAVTAGSFKLPPVRAEAMYAPQKASVASSGRIEVHGGAGEAAIQ